MLIFLLILGQGTILVNSTPISKIEKYRHWKTYNSSVIMEWFSTGRWGIQANVICSLCNFVSMLKKCTKNLIRIFWIVSMCWEMVLFFIFYFFAWKIFSISAGGLTLMCQEEEENSFLTAVCQLPFMIRPYTIRQSPTVTRAFAL